MAAVERIAVEGSKAVAVIQAVRVVVEDPVRLVVGSKVDVSIRAEKVVSASEASLLLLLHLEYSKVDGA